MRGHLATHHENVVRVNDRSLVGEILASLPPSDLVEYEITDVDSTYLDRGQLSVDLLPRETALQRGFISDDKPGERGEFLFKSENGAYMLGLVDVWGQVS